MENQKLNKLKHLLKEMKSVLIAYSGGVDSTFLLKVAKDTLGDKVLAVSARSETYPEEEYKKACQMAKRLKVEHLTVTTRELTNPQFRTNPLERCYYCKKELFKKLKQIAEARQINYIADGTNADDTSDFRPGIKALEELKIRSPLKETGFTKEEIRALSRQLKLPTWNKPPFACLASRVPFGSKITKQKLKMIAEAEAYLRKFGVRQSRVRTHGEIARVEVSERDLTRLVRKNVRVEIIKKFKELGYRYITLDLEGYRSGSLNPLNSPK